MNFFSKSKNNKIFVLIFIYAYRDFLITYRMMLLDQNFLYYHYQNIIIYYHTGELEYSDSLPMNARFLGIILQYLIFKIFPCFTLTNVSINPEYSEYFVCATFSLALLNYVCKYLIVLLFFYYTKKI